MESTQLFLTEYILCNGDHMIGEWGVYSALKLNISCAVVDQMMGEWGVYSAL